MSTFMESAGKSFANKTFIKYPDITMQYDKIRFLEPLITNDLCELSDSLGTHWSGLEYAVKTATSIEDKIERVKNNPKTKDAPPEDILKQMGDIIRYTQICPHRDIFSVAKDTIDSLTDKGYTLESVKNYYISPYRSTGYKGLHLNFISPEGQSFELQVHSEESFAAKQEGHKLYEEMRAVATPLAKKKELEPIIRKIHGEVENPKDYESLPDYKADKDVIEKAKNVELSYKYGKQKDFINYSISNGEKVLISGAEITNEDKSVLSIRKVLDSRSSDSYNGQELSVTSDGVISDKREVDPQTIEKINGETAISLKNAMKNSADLWKSTDNSFIKNIMVAMAGTPEMIMKGIERKMDLHVGLADKNMDMKAVTEAIANEVKKWLPDIEKEKSAPKPAKTQDFGEER